MKPKQLALATGGLLFFSLLILAVLLVTNRDQSLDTRSKAAPATSLTFFPAQITKNVGETFTLDVMINTGGNAVVGTTMEVTYNPTILEYVSMVNSPAFPQVITNAPATANGTVEMTVAAPSIAQPVTGTARVATITFRALVTTSGTTPVAFGAGSFVGATEEGTSGSQNFLISVAPAAVTVLSGGTTGNNCFMQFTLTIPTPTPTNTPTPTPTRTPTPTPTNTPTPTPTRTPTPTPTRTPTPTPTNTPIPTPTPNPICGAPCVDNSQCPQGHICSGGTCKLPQCVDSPTSCNPTGCVVLPTPTPTPTNTPTPTPTRTPTPTPTRTPTPTPTSTPVPSATPTPTTPVGPQCIALNIYLNGQLVANPSTLQPGQTIQIAVATGGFAERARVYINGTGPFEFTTRNAQNEFVYTYTIPLDATSLTIRAELFANGVWQVGQ